MYLLAIKLNFGPNVVMGLNEHQGNQQLLTETRITRVLPFYHSYISTSNDSFDRPSRLYMSETKMGTLAFQYSHSQSVIQPQLELNLVLLEVHVLMVIYYFYRHSK